MTGPDMPEMLIFPRFPFKIVVHIILNDANYFSGQE